MKCRNIVKNQDNKPTLVFFGSIGKQLGMNNLGRISFDKNIHYFLPIKKEDFFKNEHDTYGCYIQLDGRFVLEASSVLSIFYKFHIYKNGVPYATTDTVGINLLTSPSGLDFLYKTNILFMNLSKDSLAEDESYVLELYPIENSTWFQKQFTFTGNLFLQEYCKKLPAEEYVSGNQAVAASLIQRLSIIKGELWYDITQGIPLFDKNVTITSMDAYVIRTIMNHPNVVNISSFISRLDNHDYHCDVTVITKDGPISLTV